MERSITLRAFPPGWDTLRRVRLAREAGFRGVELNLEPGLDHDLTASDAELAALRREIERLGCVVSAVYSRQQWHQPISSLDPVRRREGAAIIERLIEVAPILGTDIVLVLPGVVDNRIFVDPPEVVPYADAWRNAQSVLREVERPAGRARVRLALENVWGKFLLSPLEFARFVDELDSEWLGAYLDVGNALRTGFPEDWIAILGQRILNVQVKDFRRSVDTINGFVGLLQGDVDWLAVRDALNAIGYDGWITGEVLPHYAHAPERLIHETAAAIDAIFGPLGIPSASTTIPLGMEDMED
jgi:L-ribulose-5-phosphate 3-epimerase